MGLYYHECSVPNTLSIRSLFTFFRRKYESDYAFKGEMHDFTEIVCVIGGKAGITADKNIYLLSNGLIVHAPNEFHKIWANGEETEVIIFSFNADVFPTLPSNVFSLSPQEILEIKDIYKNSEACFTLDGTNVLSVKSGKEFDASKTVKRLECFLLSVFSHAEGNSLRYSSRGAENYIKILSVMEEHLSDSLKAEEIASLCNISVPTLEKTVFRFLGCGAMAYYTVMKMQKASELMASGLSVKETAFSLGFANQNYFSASFKKWSGKSPSQWKKEN